MKIAGDLCVYTNHHTTLEVIENKEVYSTTKPILGYWGVRGKGQQVKHLLAYCGVDYDLTTYTQGGDPDFSMQEWYDQKYKLGLPFANLPYYIDGDVKLTESKSIMKYIAKKNNPKLLGRDAVEIALADMVSRVHDTMHQQFSTECFTNGNTPELQKLIERNAEKLSEFLGEKNYMVGDNVVFSDFSIFEMLDAMKFMSNDGDALKKHPNL